MDLSATYMLLKLLNQKSNLRALSLVGASFDKQNERSLVEYLTDNQTLKELDLSWNQMSQTAYIDILKCIVQNNNMLMLNLSHNCLIVDPKAFTNPTEEEIAIRRDKMAKFKAGLRRDKKANI